MRIAFRTFLLALSCLSLAGCGVLALGAVGGAAAGTVETARAVKRYPQERSPGTYVATILSNAVYVPAKVVLAGAGAVTSGVTYLASLGNRDVSGAVWTSTVEGTYLLTPEMIEGKESVRFVG